MPPLRRRSRVQDRNVVADAALLNGYSVQQLRNLCRQKKIASTGNKATLLNRLRGPGPQVTASNVNVRRNLREPNLPAYEGGDPQDHVVNASANDITFSEGQLNTIRQLVQESVAAASREIANEAALAAVQVLQPSMLPLSYLILVFHVQDFKSFLSLPAISLQAIGSQFDNSKKKKRKLQG